MERKIYITRDNYTTEEAFAEIADIEFMLEQGISKPVSPISPAELDYVANCEKYISQFDEDKLNSSELHLCAHFIAKCIDLDIEKSILECLLMDEELKEGKSRHTILKQNMKTLCYQVLKHNIDLSRDAQCYLLSAFMEYAKEKYITPTKK